MIIDHEATWRMPKEGCRPHKWRYTASLIMAYVIFLWLAGESIRDGLEDLQARPWTMPPRPPHISPPCIITPRPVYDWPGEFKSTTKEKGKKNGSTRPNHHTPHRSNPADGRVAGSALIPADPAKPGQKPDAKR